MARPVRAGGPHLSHSQWSGQQNAGGSDVKLDAATALCGGMTRGVLIGAALPNAIRDSRYPAIAFWISMPPRLLPDLWSSGAPYHASHFGWRGLLHAAHARL